MMSETQKKYFASPKGKATVARYKASPAGKAMMKESNAKARAKRSPEEHRAYNRAWVKANPEQAAVHRRRKALRGYGLDYADPIAHWKAEWAAQGEACKICRTTEPGSKWGWHTDHNHATGEFRGILCHKCNLTLGSAGDDLFRLRRCVEYIEEGGSIPWPHSN